MIKNPSANAETVGSILELGRSLGEGYGNSFQYSCLENSMGSRAWWATVHRITKSQTQLSTNTYTKGVGEAGGMLAPVLLRS